MVPLGHERERNNARLFGGGTGVPFESVPGFLVNYHGPPKPIFLEVFMVNNMVFRWPKPLFFMGLGAHGIY